MAHCPFDQLVDLRDLLDEIRALPEIQEPRPGIFYLRRSAFLHFHIDKTGRRWADVRDGADWGAELDLAIGASRSAQARFAREVKRRYQASARSKASAKKERA